MVVAIAGLPVHQRTQGDDDRSGQHLRDHLHYDLLRGQPIRREPKGDSLTPWHWPFRRQMLLHDTTQLSRLRFGRCERYLAQAFCHLFCCVPIAWSALRVHFLFDFHDALKHFCLPRTVIKIRRVKVQTECRFFKQTLVSSSGVSTCTRRCAEIIHSVASLG